MYFAACPLEMIIKIGSSEKFVGNFLGSLALYSSVHTGMTRVVLSVIFVETTPVIPPGIGGIQGPGMATKFGFGYVSKYLVGESFGPAFALRDVWIARADNIPIAHCLPTLRPLAHRVYNGYNKQIIFDTKKNIPEFIGKFTYISVSCGDSH